MSYDREGAFKAVIPRLTLLESELAHLARLALHGTDRDVELYVHKLAYRYRDSYLGDALAAVDEVPPVSPR